MAFSSFGHGRWDAGRCCGTSRSFLATSAIGFLLLLAASACTATVGTGYAVSPADDVVAVDTVPQDIYVYPRVEYGGRNVYYANGRWYYPNGRRWYYYRNEPPDLVRRRPYVQAAPPAYAPPAYAPPAYRSAPAPGEAVRVQ
jgi:hypothetical protein